MSAVVLDIEGTVSPLSAVHDLLFPYARERIERVVTRGGDAVTEIVAGVRAALGRPDASTAEVVAMLLGWHDENAKHSPLKTLHGLIWAAGFATGALRGVIYPDVPPALVEWRRRGMDCWVYSSGSELAQRLWFSRSDRGDLTVLLAGHFDTVSGGPKKEPASYHRIAAEIGVPAREILFLSDSAAELDAAHAAGWHAVGVSRAADGFPDTGDHPAVGSFAELRLPKGRVA